MDFSFTWAGLTLGLCVAAVSACGGAATSGSGGNGGAGVGSTTTANGTGTTSATSTGSGTDNTAQCEKLVHASCTKIFQCDPAGSPNLPDEKACEGQGNASCQGPANCPLDSSKINTCATDLAAVPCTGTSFNAPASCDIAGLCQTTAQPYCLGTEVSVSGSGSGGAGGGGNVNSCMLTLSKCSDGNSYEVSCGATCTCTINGANPKVVPSTPGYCGSDGKKNAIAACGWNLYFQ